MVYLLHSHPDKIKLAINQTMGEVATKFVEITKRTNRQFDFWSTTFPLFTFLRSGSPVRQFVKSGKIMTTQMTVKRCLRELLFPSNSSRVRTTFGFLDYALIFSFRLPALVGKCGWQVRCILLPERERGVDIDELVGFPGKEFANGYSLVG